MQDNSSSRAPLYQKAASFFKSVFGTSHDDVISKQDPDSIADDAGRYFRFAYFVCAAIAAAIGTFVYYTTFYNALQIVSLAAGLAAGLAVLVEIVKYKVGLNAWCYLFQSPKWYSWWQPALCIVLLAAWGGTFLFEYRVNTRHFSEIGAAQFQDTAADSTTLSATYAEIDARYASRFSAIQQTRQAGASWKWKGAVVEKGQKTIQGANENEAELISLVAEEKRAARVCFEKKQTALDAATITLSQRIHQFGGYPQAGQIVFLLGIAVCIMLLTSGKKETPTPVPNIGFRQTHSHSAAPATAEAPKRTIVSGFVSAPPLPDLKQPETPVATGVSGVSDFARVSETRFETHIVAGDVDAPIRELLRAVDQYLWKWDNPGNGATNTISRNLTVLFEQINALSQLGDGPSHQTREAVDARWKKWCDKLEAGRPAKSPRR